MSDLTRKYIAELDAGVRDLFASDRWCSYLEFLAKFHRYSANNTIAIYLQRPTASLVASFSDWRRKGRQVRKGERGIKIIAPHIIKDVDDDTGEIHTRTGYHIAYCFDVSQTDGEALPEGPARQLAGAVDDYAYIWDTLLAVSPVPVSIEPIADSAANGYYSHTDQRIVVRDGLAEMQRVKTVIHEIAHALLHAKGAEEADADRGTREVQAEATAYVVCRALGFDTSEYSFGYVAGWSSDKELTALKASLDAIVRTSDRILKAFEPSNGNTSGREAPAA